jgi:adenylate cyclase
MIQASSRRADFQSTEIEAGVRCAAMSDDARLQQLETSLARKSSELSTLARIAAELAGTLDLDALLKSVLEVLDRVFEFRHSMVLLYEPQREVLVLAASRGYAESGVGVEVPLGQGALGVVARRKKLLRMGGVQLQRSYAAASASKTEVAAPVLPGLPDAASLIAVPLLRGDELIGVFYVESPKLAAFDDADLSLVEAVASLAAVAIQNAQLHLAARKRLEEVERANRSLVEWNEASRRFVPTEFLAILGRERMVDVRRGDSAERVMSTFFSDVRDYTTMVEGQGAEENFEFINEYLSFMETPITAHHGFIDSYRGDGILALFPGSGDDPVRAAIESLEALHRLNTIRTQRGDRALHIGIGIDTGPLMLGTIGGERLSASVIGDSTNTAARIESLTKRYGAWVLISDRTRAAFKTVELCRLREVDRIRPKGKANPITLYEVLDGLPEEERQGKLATQADFERGLALYQAGKAGEGLVHFASALKAWPHDRAAQLYVGRCWNFIENGVPEGWDGVVTMTTK